MSDNAQDERAARAAARASWPGRLTTLEEMEGGEVVPGTPEQRLALLLELSEAAWALSGKPWPDRDRSRWPGRVIRPAEG